MPAVAGLAKSTEKIRAKNFMSNTSNKEREDHMSTTLDIQGAANLLKIHPVTVARMIRDGSIPAARIGRAYVLMERDVLDFIERQISAQMTRRGESTPTRTARSNAPGSRPESHPLR